MSKRPPVGHEVAGSDSARPAGDGGRAAGAPHAGMTSRASRPIPIVLAAAGSSHPDAGAAYAAMEEAVRAACPGHDVRWAWTSAVARAARRARGEAAPDLAEVLRGRRAAGAARAVVQSLHVGPGEELDRLRNLREPGLDLRIGAPLLADDESIASVAAVMEASLRAAAPNVLAAHGSARGPAFNDALRRLAEPIERRHPDAVLCTLEGAPGAAPLERIRDAARRAGRVHFVPLTFAAGTHVRRDFAGDGPDSWKSRLGVAEATVAPALGERAEIRAIYLRHLAAALAAF